MRTLLFIYIVLFSFSMFSQTNITDSKGLKQGEWVKFYEGTDKVLYKGTFKDGIPVGKFKFYYESGKLKAFNEYKNGGVDSFAASYYENGKVMSYGKYLNKKKDSVWVYYDEFKNLTMSENYFDGVLNGKQVIYYPITGGNEKNNKVLEINNFKDGLRHGEWLKYFKSGKVLSEGMYEVGDLKDKVVFYYSNGEKQMVDNYKNGLKHGFCYTYDASGETLSKRYFWKGKELKDKVLERHLERLRKKKSEERAAKKEERD